jgi:hypothetical protein
MNERDVLWLRLVDALCQGLAETDEVHATHPDIADRLVPFVEGYGREQVAAEQARITAQLRTAML